MGLQKGRSVALVPNFISVEDITANVESAVKQVGIETAGQVNRETY